MRHKPGTPGGFHDKAKELNCTFLQLKNRVKYFRDTVAKHDKKLPFESGAVRLLSARDIFIIENFAFLLEAVHKRGTAAVLMAAMTSAPPLQQDVGADAQPPLAQVVGVDAQPPPDDKGSHVAMSDEEQDENESPDVAAKRRRLKRMCKEKNIDELVTAMQAQMEESMEFQAYLNTALDRAASASAPRPQSKRDGFITSLQSNIPHIPMSVWNDFQQETMELVWRYQGKDVSNLLLSLLCFSYLFIYQNPLL